MSIEERQREEKEERRRTIVDAAETVLREKGREEMTMGDIAEEARLSRSLLYVYFEDMDDIVLAVTLRGLRSMRKRFEHAVTQHDVGRKQIRAVGDAYVAFSQEEPTYFDLVAQFESRSADPEDAPQRVQQCLAESDRVMGAMTKAIREGIEDGSIRSELDPTQTAITLWGCTHGLIQLAANKGRSLEQQYGLAPDALFDDGLGFLGVALAGETLDGAPDATGTENPSETTGKGE
jgi:AcrR family transcriptional regulator